MKLEEIIEIVKHDAEYFADPQTGVQAGRAFEANKILNMLYKLEPAQLQQHGVSGKRHDLEWFLSHVGERVFRNKVKCDCESCKRGGDEGVFITDKTHAKYLFDVQNELGIRYHAACADTKGGENG